ncbi:MAG TPA: protein kinase, partial [Vicinamibacterales bacterium]|nr:protein kinase [Vicinamibacterales bacterium]
MLASAPDSRAELTPGTSYAPPPAFGRFKLLHQIGAGVLGPVFRTHDPDHEHLVAVKAYTLDLTPEQASVLSAEFSRLAGLEFDSPCVAGPVAAGVEDFVPSAAAPYVSGESLDAAIRQYGPAPAGDAIRLIGHVAEALDAAARLGVFHGSLHPRDIIVTPGETHVTGFGVAQALGRVGLHGPIRRPYVAPERESGDAWGAAADIYSLAAIAYEVLTGRRALPGTDQPLPALNDVRVHDGAALREALESALDPDPGRRPGRAADFAAAFAAALSDGTAAGAAGDRAVERRPRKPRTRAPKLPGLDEPLRSPESAVSERPMPSVAEPGPAAPAGDGIRYVPVTDPADAGGAAPEPEALPAAPPDVPLDLAAEPASDSAAAIVISPFAPFEPGMLAGPTPDLRLADDVLPRANSAGETVDADLAAALDRLAADPGSDPTPAALGLDIFGPGPAAESGRDEIIVADARVDPAADTELAYRVTRRPPLQVSGLDAVEKPAQESESEDFALDFMALETPAASPDAARAAMPEPERRDDAAAEEPLRPLVRGRSAERRRTPSRYGRGDTLPPSAAGPGIPEPEIPRAFEPDRATLGARPVSEFELMARADASRPLVVPVVAGV